MAVIDLNNCVPEELAEEARLEDLLDTVRQTGAWRDRYAEILDHIYRQRLIKLIRTRSEPGQIEDLLAHLGRVLHPRRLADLNRLRKPYGARWQAYVDILDSRLAALASDAPGMVLKRAHAARILELVAKGEVRTQRDIAEILKLKPANLTRVLNLLEANELVERKPVGRENYVYLGHHGQRLADSQEDQEAARRGSHVLDERKPASHQGQSLADVQEGPDTGRRGSDYFADREAA